MYCEVLYYLCHSYLYRFKIGRWEHVGPYCNSFSLDFSSVRNTYICRYLHVVCTDRRRAQRDGRFGWSLAAILEAPHRQRHKYSALLPMFRSIWLYAVPCAYTRTRVSRSFDPRILLFRLDASLSLFVPPSQIHAISPTRSSSSSSVSPPRASSQLA